MRTSRAAKDAGRTERLDARISPEQKALILRAARLSGRSITDFVVASAQEAAERVIRSNDVITLSIRGSEAIAQAFLQPPEPNDALVAAYRRYHRLVNDE